MAVHNAGPFISFGYAYDAQSGTGGVNPDAGPSVSYQGDAILDVRTPYQPGITGKARVPAFFSAPYIAMVDAIPSAVGASIAAAQSATSGTALTLASAQANGITPNVPVLPANATSSAGLVTALGIDADQYRVATTAGSQSITLPATNYTVQAGQNVLVQQGTTFVGATVQSVNLTTLIAVLSVAMTTTAASAVLITGNASGQTNVVPTYFDPCFLAGHAKLYDPTQALARGVSVTSNNAADTGWSVTVSGYDLGLNPQTETIGVTANGVAYGKKTFKFIRSVTPSKGGGGTTTGTLAIATSDVFGFSVRNDKWEYMNVFWAGAFLTVSNGWKGADATNPATSTTGDVRGSIQVSAAGQSGTYATGGASNGTSRLAVFQTINPAAMIAATPQNTAPLFGVTPA